MDKKAISDMNAIEIELEAALLSQIREVCMIPVKGFFEKALLGESKVAEATAVQVKVMPRSQPYGPTNTYRLDVQIELNIECCSSKDGEMLVEEFSALSGRLEHLCTGNVDGLCTERFDVQNIEQTDGGSLDYDDASGQWIATFNCTILGCVK